MKKPAVGDTVYVAFDAIRGGSPDTFREMVVEKVGAKWVTIGDGRSRFRDPYRFDYKTGYIDGKGFTSPGRVYASEADYHATRAAEVAWRAFLQRLNRQYRKPDGITADAIIEARRLLALDDDK